MRNVILTGFMGTGKTTVGRILEKKLNMKLVDTDDVIEERSAIKIADIFENMGEARFRALESKAIKDVAKGNNQIIATGGGAIVDEDNLRLLKKAGKVICLQAGTDTIIDRICEDNKRPLLKGKDLKIEIEKLMQSRLKYYNKADLILNTDGKEPKEVADEIIDYLNADYEVVRVELGSRSYDIKIGAGIIKNIGSELKSLGYNDKAVVVTNDTVDAIYGDKLLKSLKDAGLDAEKIVVDDSEKSKALNVVNDVITRLLELKCERNTPLIALGGGVVGDLTGFVASIFLRGIPFIQLPTTLLAQVDSSVGGKTGVNHELGKNLIGSFYQPKLVLIDIDVLKTLPDDEMLNGISEIIKYGMIKDTDLFDYLKENKDKIIKKDEDSMKHIISRSCIIKADVVSADEKEESGLRSILNYGHTLGHALEALSHYKGIKHGKAVAIGMVFAATLAAKKGLCDKSVINEISCILQMYGIDIDVEIKDVRRIIDTMRLDKKVKKGSIKFVLPFNIGNVEYDVDASEDEISDLLSKN
jgi:3-dehydroquinate synthase